LEKIVTDPNVIPSGAQRSTSTSLIERARANDREAWQRLFDLYFPLVYRWCRYKRLQETDAEFVGQAVLIAAWKGIGRFDWRQPGDSFRAWLRTLTENKLRDFFRTHPDMLFLPDRELDKVTVDRWSAEKAEIEEASWELKLLFKNAMKLLEAKFEEKTRKAFWEVVVEKRLPKDVAADLGMTVGAVHTATSRCLRHLREVLPEPFKE
jgi:RNA polymerase sigma-70 factor (ECF subfamily)